MAITIDNVYVKSFENIVRFLAQQGTSRLRPHVQEKMVVSEAHHWETIGAVGYGATDAAQTKPAGGRQATVFSDTPWDRRITTTATYDIADTSELEDPTKMLVDPNSNIARAQGMAMRRTIDDIIIAAATGDSADNAGAVAFPAAQQVGDYGAGSVFSFDMITEVTEKFMDNDIDPDEDKVFVISPNAARKLLQLTEATSGDYNAIRPLTSKGYVESWMGYSWLVSTRLNSPGAGQRDMFAMTKRAIGLQVGKDITAEIMKDPTRRFMWVIYCHMTMGAIRIEDEHLVWCRTNEPGA